MAQNEKALKIKRILVSQPEPANPEKSPYFELHAKHNADIVYRPFIRIEGVSLKDYRSQRVDILDHTAIIFTSRTTIDHFFRICEEARINIPESMKYICNTEAVALYLQKYIVYRKRKIFYANGTFPNFMEVIMKHKSEKFLLILSEPHNPEMPQTLEKLKLNFNKVILSRTVSVDVSDMEINKFDLLVFFSPSEISSLMSSFGKECLPKLATFGEGTARAAIEAGLTVDVLAPTPQAPSMAKAILNYIELVNAGKSVEKVILPDTRPSDQFINAQAAKPARTRKPKSAASKTAVSKPTRSAVSKNAVPK